MGRPGKKWRMMKEKPGKLDEWAEGWGNDLNNGQPKPHFSLQAEAQNTELRHHQQRSSTPRLSRGPVQFISAGQMNLDESFKKLHVQTPPTSLIKLGGLPQDELLSRLNTQESQPAQSSESTSSRDQEAEIVSDAGRKKDHTSGATQSEVNNELVLTNTMGTQRPIYTGFDQPVTRPNSPCLSDSSDEVIVFAGRGLARRGPLFDRSFSQDGDRSLQGAPSTTSQGVTIRADPVDVSAMVDSRDTGSPTAVLEARDGLNQNTRGKKPKQHNGQMKQMQLEALALEEEAIADYIANIDPTDNFPNTMNRNIKLGNENVKEIDNTEELGDIDTIDLPKQYDIRKEIIASIDTKILSRRRNLSDAQYLVVEERSSADFLKSTSAEHHARKSESKQLEDEASSASSDDPGSGESQGRIGAVVQDALGDAIDKRSLWDRQVEGMTDEQIARSLSKQEELGLGSNELLLVDDIDDDEDDDEESVVVVVSGKEKSSGTRRYGNMLNRSGNNLSYPNPIPEESDANNYGNFDIMDLNRPSLGRLPKGRSRIAALGLDDEHAHKMELLWENDRSKKKIRKQEREELRAQGLLGWKSKDSATPNISSDEIKNAIREFLLSPSPRLELPVMGARDRKMVHEIAHFHKLKSKSVDDDDSNRYPVLIKTGEVSLYDERAVAALERRFGFRPRKDKGSQNQVSKSRNPRGVGGMSRFTYQDGDVVGATAPELGVENKGRAMLEKMGWSEGTALGALNNKGIMQPLVHVVRNSKAGLG